MQTDTTEPTTTTDAIRQRHLQRIKSAQQDYSRLVNIAAGQPKLSTADENSLDKTMLALGITPDELDADIAAIKRAQAAEADIVPLDEIARLDQAAVQAWVDEKKVTEENLARAEVALAAAHNADNDRRNAKAQRTNALSEIETAKKTNPRAFGIWNAGDGVDAQMKLAG